MVRVIVVGAGAVGARTARQLVGGDGIDDLVVLEAAPARADYVVTALGPPARSELWPADDMGSADVVVLASPGQHPALAEQALAGGAHVVSVADDVKTVEDLLALDGRARAAGRSLVVGAGFSPGLSCVLARHAGAALDHTDEVHVARTGTGGPACARHHHAALTQPAVDWRDGAWAVRKAGSGRELCWFPEPIGGLDCYRAGLPDARLLVPAFPGVGRVTARLAATRRDLLTSRLPPWRPSRSEGMLGAVRVEVRGRRGAMTDVVVLGALDRPALAAGTVAAVTATWAVGGRLARTGAGGLAEMVGEPLPFLQELSRRGVRAAAFEGTEPRVAS